ncbi:MAG: GxxExxY protein [bacterium]
MIKHEDTKTRGQRAGRFAPIPDETERTAREVVDAAVQIHRALGPGLLESVYETCLVHELRKRGLRVEHQVAVPVVYDGVEIASGLRPDVIVDGRVIAEVKAVEKMLSLYEAQLLTYLKLTGIRLGLLVNFNVPLAEDGIRRIVR